MKKALVKITPSLSDFIVCNIDENVRNICMAQLCEAFAEVSRLINLVPDCKLEAPNTLYFLSEYKWLLDEMGESEVIERGSYE